jgi:hypothetical protein
LISRFRKIARPCDNTTIVDMPFRKPWYIYFCVDVFCRIGSDFDFSGFQKFYELFYTYFNIVIIFLKLIVLIDIKLDYFVQKFLQLFMIFIHGMRF